MSAETLLARLLLDLTLLATVVAVLGVVLARLGQPKVLAQVMAGIALGPSLLGRFPGNPSAFLFPHQVTSALSLLGSLGLVMFAFAIGLELDLHSMRTRRREIAGVSLGAVLIPFLAGVVLATTLYGGHHAVRGHTVPAITFTLFLSTAMAITAFPVLVAILVERGIQRTRLGSFAVSSAAVQDLAGWTLLAVALATLLARGTGAIIQMTLETAAFLACLFFLVRPALRAALARSAARSGGNIDLLAIAVPYGLMCAGITQLIGLHALIGAFAAGLAFPRGGLARKSRSVTGGIMPITLSILLPAYFLTPGLSLDIGGIGGRGVAELVLLITVASGSKLIGTALPARLTGIRWGEAAPLAVLLNTRGLIELVVLTIGYTEGVLDQRLFTLLILTALVTTLATGPLLDLMKRRGLAVGVQGGSGRNEWEDPAPTAEMPLTATVA